MRWPSSARLPYREVFATNRFLRTIGLLFFLGFSTLGTFPYLGKYLQDQTGFGLILVGLILGAYGIGTLLVTTAQELVPARRGAVMSAASFTMVTSGAIGTFVNGWIFTYNSGFLLLRPEYITNPDGHNRRA